ncbi:MAG: hypothetical protein QOK19_708 [Solirubrobacteraceae bacterium]|nr:hypothetical protein [Solirubrobacterales bacterium]MEA2215147.1 hypothetical protein [Solirubrobacteraceae bacterium]
MGKRKLSIAVLVAALACMGSFAVAEAGAVQYANNATVGSGANLFGPFVNLYAAETIGAGSGLGCAGIRGVSGVVCETEPGTKAVIILSTHVNSEPYIHNHSTFTSVFNGFYYS